MSRILSPATQGGAVIIHLGVPSLGASSSYLRTWAGNLITSDNLCRKRQGFLPCSRWGLPGRLCHHRRRCALTAPFHPYLVSQAVYFLLHFPADHSGLPLATTVPCGVRTFLDHRLPTCVAVRYAAITRPTHSRALSVRRREALRKAPA